MQFVDRQSKYPGRVKITPEDGGTPYYATLARADEATVAGTPINADTLTQLYESCAPAGYGLGGRGKIVADANTAVLAGFYGMSGENAVNYPTEYAPFRFGTLFVERRENLIYQTIQNYNIVATRTSTDGGSTWGEWEFVNPPMVMGVSYRTTRRYNNKALYTALLYVGMAPHTSTKTFALADHKISASSVVRCEGSLYAVEGYYTTALPYINETSQITISATTTNICVKSSYDASGYKVAAQIWYTVD